MAARRHGGGEAGEAATRLCTKTRFAAIRRCREAAFVLAPPGPTDEFLCKALPPDQVPLLIAHSGAGPLLPAIRRAAGRPVGGYLFVDAGLPHPGRSRLDELAQAVPKLATNLRAELAAGGRYPSWDDAALRPLIPDPARRAATLAELRPRPLAFFTEALPIIADWPDAPCAYLQFSAAYDAHAAAARARDWPTYAFDAGHFHQLVDPGAVAGALQALAVAAGMVSRDKEGARCGS